MENFTNMIYLLGILQSPNPSTSDLMLVADELVRLNDVINHQRECINRLEKYNDELIKANEELRKQYFDALYFD